MKYKIVFFDCTEQDKLKLTDYFKNKSKIDLLCMPTTINESELVLIKNANIVAIHVSSSIDKALLDKLPNLKLIACRSTGYDNVDLNAAKAKKILVCNIPSYGENTVAEFAFTLMLALSRRLFDITNAVTLGHIDPTKLTGIDLSGKTLGVIGTGRIGCHSIRIARGFAMNVIAYDLYPKAGLDSELGFRYVSLLELLRTSDFITLHAPATNENDHLMDKHAFENMKRGAILINTARGSLVDTKALINALDNGQLGGAGLDVIEGEDLLDVEHELHILKEHRVKDKIEEAAEIDVLEKMPNVIVTAHNAFNSREALARIRNTTIENIEKFIAGLPQNLVS